MNQDNYRIFATTCLPRFPSDQRAQGKPFIFMPMVKVPYPKHLISFADQISLLKQRGLSFKDEAKALHLLQNISYYRLSGYWFTDTSLFPIQCVMLKSWQRLMKSTSVVMKSLLRHLSLNIPTVFLQAG